MCRFVLYMGPKIRMSSLVTEPDHSIIVQSYHSKERSEPLNGDGFGVAWYPLDRKKPAVFKSISPAWNDQNLISLSKAIKSRCVLAHVRAASPGLPVSQGNCHPFVWERYSFMHNGNIDGFQQLKRKMRGLLTDKSYNWINGSTDSETLFALFVDHLSQLLAQENKTPEVKIPMVQYLLKALKCTIQTVEELCHQLGLSAACQLNLVVTDGKSAVISRYASQGLIPNSLHVLKNHRYYCEKGQIILEETQQQASIVVASEPLTQSTSWKNVEENHVLMIDEKLNTESIPIYF